MRLAYLFPDMNSYERVEAYRFKREYQSGPNKGKLRLDLKAELQIINESFFIATFSMIGKKDYIARDMSALHEEFISSFTCRLLINEASAYYNQQLYPLINELELALRQYIYFKQIYYLSELEKKLQTISGEEKKALQIELNKIKTLFDNSKNGSKANTKKQLEDMDLHAIFKLLFVDKDFCEKIKKKFFSNVEQNADAYLVRKQDYIDFIDNTEEKVLWTDLSEGRLDIIKENFKTIQNIRNGIMHAHILDYQAYKEASKLLDDSLSALNIEMERFIESTSAWDSLKGMRAFFQSLADAIEEQKYLQGINYPIRYTAREIPTIIDDDGTMIIRVEDKKNKENSDETPIQAPEISG